MFCDQVSVTLKAGDGGDGCVSFRREKFVAHGGPDGGDGGKGGDVVLRVNRNLNSLINFGGRKIYEAELGKAGHRFDKAGRGGNDLVLEVPPGTQVYSESTGDLLVDLITHGTEFVILKGGRGGYGNAHFTSSVRQAPDFAEKGEQGVSMDVKFEMKMVADVGIIGLPSVGKSTLISRISNAKPKIADYPFTTLIPNMGVVALSKWGGDPDQSFVVADIPGLIEGAHEGKGLGHEFLRHVSRTAILLHVLDCQSHDMGKDFEVIMGELEKYDPDLASRQQIVVVNKIDTIDEETRELILEELKVFLKKKGYKGPIFMISSVSGEHLKPLLYHLLGEVQALHAKVLDSNEEDLPDEGYRVFRPHLAQDPRSFDVISHEAGADLEAPLFTIRGKRIEQIVAMSDLENRSALQRIYDVMEKMGVSKELKRLGANIGDKVQIGDGVFDFRG